MKAFLKRILRPLYGQLQRWLSRVREELLWYVNYMLLAGPKLKAAVPHDPAIQRSIKTRLMARGVEVRSMTLDRQEYLRYVQRAGYGAYPQYYGGGTGGNFTEKSLEHYVAAKVLDLAADDVYIDIASASSPAPDIYAALYGCTCYRQDLQYPDGINGDRIGGSAGRLPVADCFATKIALHCSFEHFEKSADSAFVKEAGRVLGVGGKACIVPLYMFNRYAIQTDPAALPLGGMRFESDAMLYCARKWGNRHGRFYDVDHFISRIMSNLGGLRLVVYVVENEKEIDPSCYMKFIAFFEKQGT